MPVLQLANEDARILALAITYHLGRPGSETDPDTLQRHDLGLASVSTALASRVAQARVELEVTPYQLHRIDEALLGATNELKQYEMAQRRSSVPGFAQTLARLFPELDARAARDESTSALDLVERVVMLRRRLSSTVREAEAALAAEREAAVARERTAPRWWQFWRRSSRSVRRS
jgi:hypothetical protein